jgi:hypothetical protein
MKEVNYSPGFGHSGRSVKGSLYCMVWDYCIWEVLEVGDSLLQLESHSKHDSLRENLLPAHSL